MQEKERERKGKNGKTVKIAGCSPIREGVLLVRSNTTLADVRKFGEECQRRWGITPLQIFLHKDEGHWLNGQPEAEDKESFKVGDRWFKPNYHAHIVFDWMNHETGKSRKLNDDDMMQMQTLASDILLMERGQSKAVTGKEHLERNDFIIEKQKAELQRMDAAKRHKEEQINLAEQELKQVKSEIRTDKLKKTATTAATAITSGVASLFGSGKLKELERANEKLQDEVSKRDTSIEKLQSQIQQMQKQRARNAAAIETGDWVTLREGTTEFVGYDYTEYEASILRYRQIKQKNQTLYQIVLDCTPFYAESGGQVGDTGVLVSEFETIEVIDTKKENNLPIHITKKLPEHPEAPMMACVDTDKRAACAANHSATHLLDSALREVLGEHIEQKGSLVTPDSLRFDFSHFQKVTDEEIRQVEHLVNAKIRANIPLKEYRNIPIEEAKELGAIALFGEKYGERVRVIQFGSSIEFCGGIHVAATGNIGMVKIISESSVAAGVRRIEAYTGARVEEMLDTIQDTISQLKSLFNNVPVLGIAIRKYIEENAGLKKQVEDYMKEKEASLKERLLKNIQEIHGIKVIKFCAPLPAEVVKNIAFQLRGEITENLFFVAGSLDHGKPMLTVMVSDNLVAGGLKAGNLVKEAAKLIQGGGGGQPHFATAGGKNTDGLNAAIEKVLELAGI